LINVSLINGSAFDTGTAGGQFSSDASLWLARYCHAQNVR